jgi:hypothetical protein
MKTELVVENNVLFILTSTGPLESEAQARQVQKANDKIIHELSPYFDKVLPIINDEITFSDTKTGGNKMKYLITLAVVTAGIAYLVKRKKQESIRIAPIDGLKIDLSLDGIADQLKQEAESERIFNKILSGRCDI